MARADAPNHDRAGLAVCREVSEPGPGLEARRRIGDAAATRPRGRHARRRTLGEEAGTATATLVQANEASLTIERAKARLPGWVIEGGLALALDPLRLDRVSLDRVEVPLGDLTARLVLDGGVWRGRVDIGELDVRPLVRGPWESGSKAGLPATPPLAARTLPDFEIDLTALSLRLGDTPLSRVTGSVGRGGHVWKHAALRARVEESDVRLDLNTVGERSALLVQGSDAGRVIRAFAASDLGVRGGSFHLSADLRRSSSGLGGRGHLKIHDFTMRGAPTIARILSLASFSGLGNALRGRGIPMRGLVVPFRLKGDVMRVEKARLVGSDIGAGADGTVDIGRQQLDLSGTVAPAYTLDRILARIPLLGSFLSGRRSRAALAGTFTIRGQLSEPRVQVNPLAALVPGVIRDLFAPLEANAGAR